MSHQNILCQLQNNVDSDNDFEAEHPNSKHTGPDYRHENLVHNGSENFQDLGVLQQLCNSEPQNLSDLSVLQLVARPS